MIISNIEKNSYLVCMQSSVCNSFFLALFYVFKNAFFVSDDIVIYKFFTKIMYQINQMCENTLFLGEPMA